MPAGVEVDEGGNVGGSGDYGPVDSAEPESRTRDNRLVPTADAEDREDRVVVLVVEALVSAGSDVVLLDRPDRNPDREDGLTVDAELCVDGKQWALDVMVLRWRSDLESSWAKLEKRVADALGKDLERANRSLTLSCHPPSNNDAATDRLVALAAEAVRTGERQQREDQLAVVRPRQPGDSLVKICPLLASTSHIRSEIERSSGPALQKKLAGQLTRARNQGYRVALALDQRGASDSTVGANFLPQRETVASVVAGREEEVGISLDAVYLVDTEDSFHLLR